MTLATPPPRTGERVPLPDGMPDGWPRTLAVLTITIGLTMSVLANSMTNLALPYIAHDLAISAESSIWIVNASQIAVMVSLLPVAALADIVGWPRATGEALLYELSQRADQPEFRLSHAWREGDVIVWDNRAVLHRATYYDTVKYKRFMQRTTIGGDLPTVPQ